MEHLADGALRRMVDEAGSPHDAENAHLAVCADCRSKMAAVARDAEWTKGAFVGALAAANDAPDSARAWSALQARLDAPPQTRSFRTWLIVASAAAAMAGLLAFTPVGTLAQNFLTIFEPQQFVAVPVLRSDLTSLPDLTRFGTVSERISPRIRAVSGSAAAAALAGFAVARPTWLPQGVPAAVRYAVTSGTDCTFTFSAKKALAAAKGRETARMPQALDGATLELRTHPAVIISYGESVATANEQERDFPQLVIVQAPLPAVTSNGATVGEIESYLLNQPGVSPALANQIRTIGDPATTVPIPIPVDRAFGQSVRVQGATGLGIGDDTGVGGVVIWQKNGIIYGVAGRLRQRDVLAIAESMR